MRVKNAHTQFPAFILWTGFAVLTCFGLAVQGGAEGFNYEKLHQRALSDDGFRRADEALNEAYVQAMRKLPKEERAKLRQEERAWIQENSKAVQQGAGQEVEVLRERTRKRLEEFRRRAEGGADPKSGAETRLTLDSPAALQLGFEPAAAKAPDSAQSNSAPAKETALKPVVKGREARADAAKPVVQGGDATPEEEGWTPKAAANLERVYQKSLKDAEFKAADTELRSFYRQAMQVLSPADREKLRVAEKAWVRQNGMLVRNAGDRELAVLKERTAERRTELEQMTKERRFQEGAPVAEKPVAPAPRPAIAAAVLELPVEPLSATVSAKPPEPRAESAPSTVEAPTDTKSAGDAEDDGEPGHLTEKGFWMFLASWIFGLTALHYGAFRSVQKNPSKSLSRDLSPVRLYLLSAGCAGTSLSMLSSGGGVAWVAASVFLSCMGLLVVWYAALAVAALSRDSADMVAASGAEGASAEDRGR
jgi:uncharacterized protein YecT (DUF1311 family)